MNKKFFIAWIAVFVVWFAGSYVVHGVLLHGDYAQLSNLFRSEEESMHYFHWMIVAQVMMSGALTWIYSRGIESGSWVGQGIRFGIAVALLTTVPTYIVYYVVEPLPGSTVVRQIVFDGLLTLIIGLVVAFVYRGQPAKS